MLALDGGYGEGGGQLVRTACALSAITGTPFRLHDIRARRDPPGLAPQHLTAARRWRGGSGHRAGRTDAALPRGAGAIEEIGGVAHVANLPLHIVERMQATAGRVHIEPQALGSDRAIGPGGAIVVWARCAHTLLGGAEVAQRGVPAERIARNAAEALRDEIESGAALDAHALDQLLVYAALARGTSLLCVRAWTSHARTTAWLIEQFLPVRIRTAARAALVCAEIGPA